MDEISLETSTRQIVFVSCRQYKKQYLLTVMSVVWTRLVLSFSLIVFFVFRLDSHRLVLHIQLYSLDDLVAQEYHGFEG